MAIRYTHLNPKKTLFMLCDIQEKFRPAIPLMQNLIVNAIRLTTVGKVLDVPLLVSEQYPSKLGKTVKEIDVNHAARVVAKTRFSMMVPDIESCMKNLFNDEKPMHVVLYGVEAHVCVEQTAIDLLERDINVHLVGDCVASRSKQDRDLALERMRSGGCVVTTCEHIIYDLLREKDHPKFNDLRKLLLQLPADMQISSVDAKPK